MAITTFIVPSLGRPTLNRALDSIRKQTDQDWKAIVCFDRVEPTIIPDDKIKVERFYDDNPPKFRPGIVRNYAIKSVTTPWVAFLDDDDTITTNYVAELKVAASTRFNHKSPDMVIFKMQYDSGKILPRGSRLHFGGVGISFACRRELFNQFQFLAIYGEDWGLIYDCMRAGKTVRIVDRVTYHVKY